MTAAYERAGLTAAEVEQVANLVGAAEAADPLAPWVAVARADLLGVVAALDRLVDTAAVDTVMIGTAGLVIVGAVGRDVPAQIVVPDLDELTRVLRRGPRVRR
jgi:hypothetical protein